MSQLDKRIMENLHYVIAYSFYVCPLRRGLVHLNINEWSSLVNWNATSIEWLLHHFLCWKFPGIPAFLGLFQSHRKRQIGEVMCLFFFCIGPYACVSQQNCESRKAFYIKRFQPIISINTGVCVLNTRISSAG